MADNFLTHPQKRTFAGEILALHIFAKHDPKGLAGHYDMDHQHDVGYGPKRPAPESVGFEQDEGEDDFPLEAWPEASREDAQTLLALGWSWDSEAVCWIQF